MVEKFGPRHSSDVYKVLNDANGMNQIQHRYIK
jgi:hypothetical protein